MGDSEATATSKLVRKIRKDHANGIYFWNDLIAAPVSEAMLGYFYLGCQKEGLLPIIFHEGVPTLRGFLKKFSKLPTVGGFRQIQGQDQAELCGIGWSNTLEVLAETKRAAIGMGFFRGYAEPDFLLRLGQLMLLWAFERYGLDIIHGITPEPNRAARLFYQRMGFKSVGPIPLFSTFEGRPCDAYVSWMKREEWLREFDHEES